MDENRIEITWYGTASVRIVGGSTQLLIDPFFPFPDSKIKVPSDAYDNCSHIFISHGHFDHIGSIKEIAKPDTHVYCTKTPYRTLCRKGVDEHNLILIKAGTVITVGDFKITAYKGKHIKLNAFDILKSIFNKRVMKNRKGFFGKLFNFTSCTEKKESLCYLVEGFGRRIFILGSLALADDIDYPEGADIAFFPYQGKDDLFRIASDIYGRLRPKAVLLTHFDDTFPPFSAETDTSDFQKYMKDRAAVYKLRNGGSLEI